VKEYKYYALVYDSNITRRTRLKTAALASVVFDRIDVTQSDEETLNRLSVQNIDVVFISGMMTPEEQSKLITNAKLTRFGSEAAYICVQSKSEQNSSVLSAGIIRGIDGILWEPYSTTDVAGTAIIAEQIKALNLVSKTKAAANLLLDEALSCVDQIGGATLSGSDETFRTGMQKLRKIGPEIRKMASEKGSLFIEVYLTRLSEVPPKTRILLRQPYGGVSQRVQRVIDRRTQN